MAQLKLINLSKKFGETIAVQNITLTIQDGEFLTLLGPSGCGKTTTLRMIAGFAQPTSGAIELDGQVITSAKKNIFLPPEKRNMGIGLLYILLIQVLRLLARRRYLPSPRT